MSEEDIVNDITDATIEAMHEMLVAALLIYASDRRDREQKNDD